MEERMIIRGVIKDIGPVSLTVSKKTKESSRRQQLWITWKNEKYEQNLIVHVWRHNVEKFSIGDMVEAMISCEVHPIKDTPYWTSSLSAFKIEKVYQSINS